MELTSERSRQHANYLPRSSDIQEQPSALRLSSFATGLLNRPSTPGLAPGCPKKYIVGKPSGRQRLAIGHVAKYTKHRSQIKQIALKSPMSANNVRVR